MAFTNAASLKLGRRPPKYDSRMLRLITYYDRKKLAPPPVTADWIKGIKDWGMMGNDQNSNCTFAALAHAIQVWTNNLTNKMVTLSDKVVLDAYFDYTGGDDNGGIELDVLKYFNSNGIGGHKGISFVALDTRSHIEFKTGTHLFGGTYSGIAMPASAQEQLDSSKPWDLPRGQKLTGDWLPGSWGGHAMWIAGYDDAFVYYITWGAVQKATWAWFDTYNGSDQAELWSIVSPPGDWWDVNSKMSAVGIDVATLRNDLNEVASLS